MAIIIEGISVITKVHEIKKRVPDGWEGFKKIIPNKTLCSDNEIARVGFMSPDEARSFIAELESHSLVFQSNGESVDIAVVEQIQGLTTKCSWLEFGHINLNNDPKKRVAACKLVGSKESQLFTPSGWEFENSLTASYIYSPTSADKKGLKFLRFENGLEVYLSELTGKEVYLGRTTDSPKVNPNSLKPVLNNEVKKEEIGFPKKSDEMNEEQRPQWERDMKKLFSELNNDKKLSNSENRVAPDIFYKIMDKIKHWVLKIRYRSNSQRLAIENIGLWRNLICVEIGNRSKKLFEEVNSKITGFGGLLKPEAEEQLRLSVNISCFLLIYGLILIRESRLKEKWVMGTESNFLVTRVLGRLHLYDEKMKELDTIIFYDHKISDDTRLKNLKLSIGEVVINASSNLNSKTPELPLLNWFKERTGIDLNGSQHVKEALFDDSLFDELLAGSKSKEKKL